MDSLSRKRRMTARNKNRKKLMNSQPRNINNNNMEDVGEDCISKLPESIIHHVLSLLPIKCAVSTTVLSKTWKNQWVSVPVFDLREWRSIATHSPGTEVTVENSNANVLIRQKDTDKFMDFLDSTLFSNGNMSTIQKFCLCCDKFFDVIRVREWITGLIKRKVEELMLTVDFPRANPVPSDLFTCESLTVLNIDFVKQHVLDFPLSVSLPRLKKLRLSYVLFNDRAATQKLFSSPILEELVLCKCSRRDSDVISFSAPRLKFFALKGTFKLLRLCYNLRVEIDAPDLVSIEYAGWLPNEFLMGSFPSLVEAGFHHVRENKTTLDSLSKFVRLCSNIKLLKASSLCFQIFGVADVPSISSPTFNSLVCLELADSNYYQYPVGLPFLSMSSFFKFLHFSPNLESLVINQVYFDRDIDGYVLSSNTTPPCLLLSLNSIEFRNFKGSPLEMEFARLLLKHARVLQLVIIRGGNSLRCSSSKIIPQLQNFPRASKYCSFQLLPRIKRTSHDKP